VGRTRGKRNAYRNLLGKPKGNSTFVRHVDIWKNKMNAGLTEIGWERMNWTDLSPDRNKYRDRVNAVVKLCVTKKC